MTDSGTKQREAVALALVVTAAAHAVPHWLAETISLNHWVSELAGHTRQTRPITDLPYELAYEGLALLFGLVLVLPAPTRYGLCVGAIRQHWRGVLLVCGLPLLACFIVAPFVELPKFHVGMWLVSPLAQDLVFCGFIYTILDDAFPGRVHPRVPMHRTIFLTAFFFSLWHVPNFRFWPAGFVCLQLCYTFAGAAFVGLARQWTGSLLYITAAHSIGNCYAWALSRSAMFPVRLWE